jgi:hypothetical protein
MNSLPLALANGIMDNNNLASAKRFKTIWLNLIHLIIIIHWLKPMAINKTIQLFKICSTFDSGEPGCIVIL